MALSNDDSRIKLRFFPQETHMDVALLFFHPMHMGYGTDRNGTAFAPEYIETIRLYLNDHLYTVMALTIWMSRNPLIRFNTHIINEGTRFKVEWIDNRGVIYQHTGLVTHSRRK